MRHRFLLGATVLTLLLIGEPVFASSGFQLRISRSRDRQPAVADAMPPACGDRAIDPYWLGIGPYDSYPIVRTPRLVAPTTIVPPMLAAPVAPLPTRIRRLPDGSYLAVPDRRFHYYALPSYPRFRTGGSGYFPTPDYHADLDVNIIRIR